uniref:Transmembrane protein 188 n=1 Tax=Globodera pallida TaxID=36090 RepID=A0A183BVG5_GLOPA
MEDPSSAYEDMLFFERRLTEVITGMQPKVRKWRVILFVLLLSTAYTAYYWVFDPALRFISFRESLAKHLMFTACISLLLIFFLFFGVHKRVVAPKIIALRCRCVLGDFCLSCDEHGKLIVRPAYPSSSVSPPPSTYAPPASSLGSSHQQQQHHHYFQPTKAAASSVASRHSFGGRRRRCSKFHQFNPSTAFSPAHQHAQNSLDPSRLIDASPVETLIQQLVENGTEFLHLLSHSAASSAESLASPTNTTDSSNDAMIVVDEKAIEIFPLDTLLPMIVVALSVSFIVIGGAIPYVFQYAEIYRRKSAAGFSLLVCLALCIANILRIEFWIGKRFELPLLVQSIVMLAVMAGMLEISVRMNRRIVPLTARTSVWSESTFKKIIV